MDRARVQVRRRSREIGSAPPNSPHRQHTPKTKRADQKIGALHVLTIAVGVKHSHMNPQPSGCLTWLRTRSNGWVQLRRALCGVNCNPL